MQIWLPQHHSKANSELPRKLPIFPILKMIKCRDANTLLSSFASISTKIAASLLLTPVASGPIEKSEIVDPHSGIFVGFRHDA